MTFSRRDLSRSDGWVRCARLSGLRTIGLGVAILLVLVGSFALLQAIRKTNQAEYALHATVTTVQVVEEYVKRTHGDWPTSWEELESVPCLTNTMFRWPDDRATIQRYVFVDFGISSTDLATADLETFDAIRPIGSHYDSYKPYVADLLKTIREENDGRRRNKE